MVKKSSFFEKLKHRWKSGSGMKVERSAENGEARGAVEARLDRGLDQGGSLAPFSDAQRVAGRKLSSREDAVVAMGEGFQELSNLVRGVQSRVDDHGDRAAKAAEEIRSLPALGRSQLEALERIAAHFERQTEVGDQLLQTLGGLPELLTGVRDALAKATATDARTADTLDQFRQTMDRIEGSMERMVESSSAQVGAAKDLVQGRQAEEERVVRALQDGRDVLVETQREGVERIENATATRLEAIRRLHEDQTARLGKLVADNGRWTQLLVVLLSLTFFAIAGILAVLALR